jgi:hypothetical protein
MSELLDYNNTLINLFGHDLFCRIEAEGNLNNISSLKKHIENSYELVNLQDVSNHKYLADQGISKTFLEIAANGAKAISSAFKDRISDELGLSFDGPGISPKVRDALILAETGKKYSLSPWTNLLDTTVYSPLAGWYTFKNHDQNIFFVGQTTQPFLPFQDTIWILPSIGKIIYVDSTINIDSIFLNFTKIIRQAFSQKEIFFNYMNTPNKSVQIYDWHCEHFGHYVWNTLSAWGSFFSKVKPKQIDKIICSLPNSYFGSIKEIFASHLEPMPSELNITNPKILENHIFQDNALIASIQSDYLSENTCRTVVEHSLALCNNEFKNTLLNTKELCWPVVLFSLRFENRAWDNQIEGYINLAKAIRHNFPNAAFFLHGISKGVAMGSTTSWMSLETELNASDKILAELTEANIPIASAVGLSIHESVAVSEYSDIFVAPTGSGMALYKWLTNKPGVSFSNTFSLDTKNPKNWMLNVFERYRENILESHRIPLSAITDLEEERHGIGNRANFTLDQTILQETVIEFLRAQPRR